MRRLSINIVAAIFSVAFVAIFPLFLMNYEYSIPAPEGWADNFQIRKNPVTENLRVYDTEAKVTVFWSSGNPAVLPTKIEKIGDNRWIVEFEKPMSK